MSAMLSVVPEAKFRFWGIEEIQPDPNEQNGRQASEKSHFERATESEAEGFLIEFEVFEGAETHYAWIPFRKIPRGYELYSFSNQDETIGVVSRTELTLPPIQFEVLPVNWFVELFTPVKKDAFFQFYKNKNFRFWRIKNQILAVPENLTPESKDFHSYVQEKTKWDIKNIIMGKVHNYLGAKAERREIRVDSVVGANRVSIVLPGQFESFEVSPEIYSDEDAYYLGHKSAKHYWLFSQKIYVSKDSDLLSEDVVALATEEINKRRLRLEKAHALAAMTKQLDTRAKRQTIPQDIKTSVWQRDNGRCVECESQVNLEFDHIIPLAMGGSNSFRNLQLLCETCNRRKGASLG